MAPNIPAYILIESLLRNKILTGQFEPGQRLPNEEELAAQFDVSRITIRTALSHLVDENLIVRKRAKGSFVAEDLPIEKQFLITGGVFDIVLDTERYKVKTLGMDTVAISETKMARELADFFGAGRDQKISVVRRVRNLNKIPVNYVENYLLPEIAERLPLAELSKKPILRVLKDAIKMSFGKSEVYFESVPAEPDVAERLHSTVFAPLVQTTVCYRLSSGDPFFMTVFFMRPEYFKFKMEFDGQKLLGRIKY